MRFIQSAYLAAISMVAAEAHFRSRHRMAQAVLSDECEINVLAAIPLPDAPHIDDEYGCFNSTGAFIPLYLDQVQEQSLMDLAANGTLRFGLSKIDISGATVNSNGTITLPPGYNITVVSSTKTRRRDLQAGTGDKHYIVFRVTDVNGLVHPDSPALMSDNFFGTNGDSINIKSQMAACSVGKYNVVPGGKSGYDICGLESAPGVIDITIDISLNNFLWTVLNAMWSKAQEVLDSHFGTSLPLTTYADHVLFVLEGCYRDCGWAAYAFIGGFISTYQSDYYSHAAVVLHEIGHQLELAHSRGIDGQEYTDHTCLMGNPLYGDDLGEICFNPAKNWQLQFNPHPITMISGWYDPQDFIEVDTSNGARTIKMMGIGEYNLQGDGVNVPRKAVALRIENGPSSPAQYIAFNSAKGANAQNDEASDLVTIVEKTGIGYAYSWLKGYIGASQSFITTQGRIITAQCINTAVTPSVACVCVRESSQTCPTDCACVEPIDPNARWYPDWVTNTNTHATCVHNSNYPPYMDQNPVHYLFSTKEGCCQEHFSWEYPKCIGTTSNGNIIGGGGSAGLWYPDWTSGQSICKNDRNAPEYMKLSPSIWMFSTQRDCCTQHFSWKLAGCIGTATCSSNRGTGKYYPDWAGSNTGCVVDGGSTPAPEYMRASGAWFYNNLDQCCAAHYSWNLSACKGQITASTGLWYVNWSTFKCVKDCATGEDCGGVANGWDILHGSKEQCCQERVVWNYRGCMA